MSQLGNGSSAAGANNSVNASGGDPLFDSGAGANSGAPGASGSSTPPGDANGGAAASGNGTPATGSVTPPSIPSNWKDILPPELRDADFMKNVSSVEVLAKNYANAQKVIGADKMPIPGPNSSDEEWRAAYERLGLPKDVKEYKPELAAGFDKKLDKDFLENFNKQAHLVGLLPKQAKQIAEWFGTVNETAFNAQTTAAADAQIKALADFKTEMGAAYDNTIIKAKVALKEYADEPTQKFIRESGLGRRPEFLKFLAKISETTLSEGKIKGDGGIVDGPGAWTPDTARKMINEIKADLNGPYYKKDHAQHSDIKAKMALLYQAAFPGPAVVRKEA